MLLPNYPGKTGGFAPTGNTMNSAFSFRFQAQIWDYIQFCSFLFYLNFTCVGAVLPVCKVSVSLACLVPVETRRRCWGPWNCS